MRIDRTRLAAGLEETRRKLERQNNALKQGVRACQGLERDEHLDGEAWKAAKTDTRSHQYHALNQQLERNRRIEQACQCTIHLAESLPADLIDEDSLDATIGQIKAADRQMQDTVANGEPLISYLTTHFAQLFHDMCQEATDTLQDYIRVLHEFDRQATAIWNTILNDTTNDTNGSHAGSADVNAVMAKLLDGKMSKAEMITLFESQFGMTPGEAKGLADFTIKYLAWSRKNLPGNAKDVGYFYCVILASMQYGDNNKPNYKLKGWKDEIKRRLHAEDWKFAGGLIDQNSVKFFLTHELGYSEDDAKKFIAAMRNSHGNNDADSDFLHTMAGLTVMQNTSTTSLMSKLGNLNRKEGPNNREGATWAGDIVSGSMSVSDANADMDAINIQQRIDKARKVGGHVDTMAIAGQYYADLQNGKTNRANEFCAYYGGGDPNKGRTWLQNNAADVANKTDSLGGALIGGDGTPKQTPGQARQLFLDQIDNERKNGNNAGTQ